MKKFYSLALIILSLFSCVLFSACGNKYDDLKMKFYSSDGEVLEEVCFMMDDSKSIDKKRVGIKFSGIDQEDIGQVVVYSLPNELVTVSNYKYSGDMCYVDITPNMSNMENAKLVVSHLSSGKKQSIPLKINQKANNLSVINSNYIISIPDDESKTHIVNFSKLISLLPLGSTDKIYFKTCSPLPDGVDAVALEDIEGYEDVFTGFEVSSSVDDSIYLPFVKIYPVTYMEGYEDEDKDKYESKIITIYFAHVLNEDSVTIHAEDSELDLNNIQLIANDSALKNYELNVMVGEKKFSESNFFDMYELTSMSEDIGKVTSFVDTNSKVVLTANVHTEDLVNVEIELSPKGYVGEIVKVVKVVKVKGDIKPDTIKITKNGKIVPANEKTSIFDYYEEGNSLGSLFYFNPISNNNAIVHESLNRMQILVNPDILSEHNCDGTEPAGTEKRLYILEIHNSDEYLSFTYDGNVGMMVSEPITSTSRIYIKYNDGDGDTESSDFGIKIRTFINNELIPQNWEGIEPTEVKLNFDRQVGVKSMVLEAGEFEPIEGDRGVYDIIAKENPRNIYLDRLEGVDNDEIYTKFISVPNSKVLAVDGEPIAIATFEVEVKPLFDSTKPLTLINGVATVDNGEYSVEGQISITYVFNKNIDEDVIGLVFRKDTDIGNYEVVFSQEGIKKASVIVNIYESLNGIDESCITFETNKKAFRNSTKTEEETLYTYENYTADYIVAAGQELGISVDLSDFVLKSNIVMEYGFEYVIGPTLEGSTEDVNNTYFRKVHDDKSFNNAILDFIKGTYDDKNTSDKSDDVNNYIYLTITVKTKKFENIVTESAELDDTNKYTLSFYIYEEIKDEDLKINHVSMTRYMSDYLGKYNEKESEATLNITMDEKLWNYVTGETNVSWRIDTADYVQTQEIGDAFSLKFRKSPGASSSYVRKVKAYIEQFEHIFEFQCVFNVENPIISERLIIDSPVKMYDDENNDYYINLKNGGSYTVEARNVSSKGKVTHNGIIIQVVDEYGSAYSARDYFDINQETSTITVKKVDNHYKFKLIVFAKDALKYIASSDLSGYNSPSSFLLDGEGVTEGLYKNAYFIIHIELSDGTEDNPYLITNADEFWEIDDTEAFKIAYYKLMTSISLDNTTDTKSKYINGFKGSITTPVKTVDAEGNPTSYQIYTVDGIVLNGTTKNLFVNTAEDTVIENIKFIVEFNYNIVDNVNIETSLGLFDINRGALKDVSVQGQVVAELNGNVIYYFGLLAGKNIGTIKYTTGIGASGEIGTLSNPIKGNSKVYLGGLVGMNTGSIIGNEQEYVSSENIIELNGNKGRQNALSTITINSTLTNGSAIGGVVGINTYNFENLGTIRNAFVQATINAEITSNVGGVIGENKQEENTLKVTLDNDGIKSIENVLDVTYKDKAIYNVKSASTIKANNDVGGIVGKDANGLYVECDYQVLPTTSKSVALVGVGRVGGIAGSSNKGKFLYCSVMSYNWNYAGLKTEYATVITDCADIQGVDYVGGIVGYTTSSTGTNDLTVGENLVDFKVIVAYSSVNAYMIATGTSEDVVTGEIGGILSSGVGSSVLFNVYFIGKIEGDVSYIETTTNDGVSVETHYLCLDNNKTSIYNAVYTINLVEEDGNIIAKLGHVKDKKSFVIDANSSLDYWWWNAGINGGYIFVTTDNSSNTNKLPIFDLSPDSIDVKVKNPKEAGLEKVLVLDYYDFSVNGLDTLKLSTLNEKYNRNKKLIELLDITVKPENIGTVVLNVTSSKPSVVDITFDGRLLINGVGECELVLSAQLNPNAGNIEDRTIKVVVDYPIGDDFNITTSKTDVSQVVSSLEKIAKDGSKQYFAVTSGKVQITNEDTTVSTYKYRTKETLNLKVEVSYLTPNLEFDISKYVMISGIKTGVLGYDAENGLRTYTIELDYKTPFNISVLKCLESSEDYFTIKVTPYTFIKEVKVEYGKNSQFNLSTLKGATNVGFSYEEAIVYPNDTVYLTTFIETDAPICMQADGNIDIVNLQTVINTLFSGHSYNGLKFKITNKNNILYSVYVDSSSYNSTKQTQTISLRIEFAEMNLTKKDSLTFELQTENGASAVVNYLIYTQRINKIEIKNYYYKNIEEDGSIVKVLVQEDALKPSSAGKIVLDIAPSNGYYDYLEISDITGNEEILFIQVDENGNAVSVKDDPSSDGKGIKLYPQADTSRLYIRTQISNLYSSKLHTIEVRAYDDFGNQLGDGFTKEIDVKMLPEIVAEEILPSGEVGDIVRTTGHEMYLASHVDSRFRITTFNSNSDMEIELLLNGTKTSNFALVKDVGNNYILKQLDKEDYLHQTLTLKLRTYAYMDNGDFDIAEISIDFTIVSFVVHSVSVNSSIKNISTKEIYGYFDKGIDLNFYFDKTDISYYNMEALNDPFWDTVYRWERGINLEAITNEDLKQIYTILQELNSYDNRKYIDDGSGELVANPNYGVNDYLILNDNKKDGDYYTYNGIPNNIELANNRLMVKYNSTDKVKYSPDHLAVAFKLYLNNSTNKWEIGNYASIYDEENYIVDTNYYLNFKKATAWFEPTVITTSDEFKAMESGGRYILANDIVLKDYTPINADLVEFDGNGRTITIQSFAVFNEESIQAGLFAKVYGNMIVKNVVVNYQSINPDGNYTFGKVDGNGIIYADLCNNIDVSYTDARFGGIAAVNYGIITNCIVNGTIAINASTIEQKKEAVGDNYEINFFIGGLVADNDQDESGNIGYITNSTTNLNVYAQANIGGFVYKNSGKIASCAVEKASTIYSYNSNLEKTIVVDVAGFVVENSGQISMSYVNFEKASNPIFKSIYPGTMSAKDISAGFVYSNSGEISDAYVQMTETGINNNTFSGFVFENGGKIVRSYTYINNGSISSSDDNMFAPAGTTNLENCIEFVIPKTGYASGISKGLVSLNTTSKYNKKYYEEQGFAFGDNKSAVWTISSSSLPKLVSTLEKVVYTGNKELDGLLPFFKEIKDVDGGTITIYTPNYAYYGTKENPYIIHDVLDIPSQNYTSSWSAFFTDNTTAYYRIVKDIDFSVIGDNPNTSTMTFSGNIQGNNMKLSNIMLYSSSNLNSIGLFKDAVGVNDVEVANSIRNLTLSTSSVWASKTEAVGLLAGIVENFNLYNINIDAPGVIMVGGNAVGGVAGLVHGEIDIDQITTNIGANSTRASTLNQYSIYISQNNKQSSNLSSVYYAGSAFGIIDGYNRSAFDVSASRDISKKYFKVNNIKVSDNITVLGDSVGAVAGFVGERVYMSNVTVDAGGALSGAQYSAGLAGENRGVINNVQVTLGDNMFEQSAYVSAGVVGLNLGGLVTNVSSVKANIHKTGYGQTVAGVIGRNIYGTLSNVSVDSKLFGYYVGGFIGSDYTDLIFIGASTGSGAISSECKLNRNLIPSTHVEYTNNGTKINNFTNLYLSRNSLNYLIETKGNYYTYQPNETTIDLPGITVEYRVLGLIVGLSNSDTIIKKVSVDTINDGETTTKECYNIVADKDNIMFNTDINKIIYNVDDESLKIDNVIKSFEDYSVSLVKDVKDCVLREDKLDATTNVKYDFTDVNVLNLGVKSNNVMYIIGSTVGSFDTWERNYSNEYLLIK